MVDLTYKYRPLKFRNIVGQTDSTAWMKEQIGSKERRSVLISGPIGTGKTSSGLIYARAILCDQPNDGEPCTRCTNCRDFGDRGERVPDFCLVKCGEQGGIEKVQEILEFARTAPFYADRRVLMLDEAHNLSRRSFQALLDIAEHPPAWVTLILVTSEKNDVPGSLISRLHCLDLKLVRQADALSFMADICKREGIEFEHKALDLISGDVGGYPRRLLRAIEKVSGLGPVNEQNVRSALGLDFDELLAAYVAALLEGDAPRQLRLIEEWPDTPQRKLAFLHQFLTFCYLQEVRRFACDDAIMRTLPQALRSRLVREFADRATSLKLDVHTFWHDAVATLEPKETLSRSQMAMIVTRFDRLINARRGLAPAATEQFAIRPSAPQKLRVQVSQQLLRPAINSRPGQGAAGYLSWPEVKPIWEIGSFLPQQFGLLFNVRLTLNYEALGIHEHGAATQLLSDLTHDLGARIAWWEQGSRLHWVYRHEADHEGKLLSRVLLAVPGGQVALSLRWLTRFAARRAGAGGPSKCWSQRALRTSYRLNAVRSEQVRFHWQGVRALSRGLDPRLIERAEDGKKRPLVDLLRLPARWRGPIGELPTAQAIGASKALTRTARRRVARSEMPLLSALNERAWRHLDAGWEIDEHAARVAEAARRESTITQVNLRFPGKEELSMARRRKECLAARAAFDRDPKSWLRTWDGWWLP